MEEVPRKLEVQIKILITSLCHTDVYFWEAKLFQGQTPVFPRILGHKACRIVESVGEGLTDLASGYHVLLVFTEECKECAYCKSEGSNICDLLRINTDRVLCLMMESHNFQSMSSPSYTSLEHPPLVNTLQCMSTVFPRSTPLRLSTKFISLALEFQLAAEGARIDRASRIIGVDLNPNRFESAKKFGVTEFVNPKYHNKPVQEDQEFSGPYTERDSESLDDDVAPRRRRAGKEPMTDAN
ncbi:hypothetical protein AgCh_021619 [Apium graveolens]